jgi:exopolysaccharide biosynthesis polyprenyl glycosylphosphotransferase
LNFSSSTITEMAPATQVREEATGLSSHLVEVPPAMAPPRELGRRRQVVRRSQTAADIIALAIASLLLSGVQRLHHGQGTGFIELGAVLLPCWLMLSSVHRLHLLDEERADHSTPDDLVRVFQALLVALFVAASIETLLGLSNAPTFTAVAAAVVVTYPLLIGSRAVARAVARRRPGYQQRALVIGAGDVGRLVARKLAARADYGIEFVGFIEPTREGIPHTGSTAEILGDLAQAERIVMERAIDRVFIAFSLESDHDVADVARRLEDLGVQVDIVPRLYELVGPRATFHTVEGLPMIGLPVCRPSTSIIAAKRALDIVVAAAGLLAVSPILAVIAVRVRLDSPGPIFYRSQRIGSGGHRFGLLKFRTMRTDLCRGDGYGGAEAEAAFAELMADPLLRAEFEHSHKLRTDPRVTKFGGWLRRTSLDELPQLVNVLKGDMTLVGPRAITTDEWDELFADGWKRTRGPEPYWRIDGLRPGVTGWWQIHGRSDTSYDERIRLDATYASSLSLRLDMLIIARTVRVLFGHNGAY